MNNIPANQAALSYNQALIDKLVNLGKPLFDNLGVKAYGYAKFFQDGSYIDLFSDIRWQNHYFEYFNCTALIQNDLEVLKSQNTGYVLWGNSDIEKKDPIVAASYAFNLWHGLRIYERHTDGIECWHFAAHTDNYQIVNLYVNSLDLFKHFILYFRDKTSSFINTSQAGVLARLGESIGEVTNMSNFAQYKQDFLNNTNISHYHLKNGDHKIALSKREAQCLNYLQQHKTIKEIAKFMELSPRTVESYLNNVKMKAGCSSINVLLDTFRKSFIVTG